MEIYADDLRVGDKVNCHEDGWLVVRKVKPSFILNIVTFEKDDYFITKYFRFDEKVFVVR